MAGTGLKKCMPMKRSGREISAASRVIEIEDVFVAMIASGANQRVDPLEDRRLQGDVFRRRLDHEVGWPEGIVADRSGDAPERRILVRPPTAFRSRRAGRGRARTVGDTLIERGLADVDENDVEAGGGRHLGNAACPSCRRR